MTENGKRARTKSFVRFSAIGIWKIHRLYSIAFLLTSASLMREKRRPSYMDFANSILFCYDQHQQGSIQANPFASGRRLKHSSVLQLTDVFIHSDAILEQVSV